MKPKRNPRFLLLLLWWQVFSWWRKTNQLLKTIGIIVLCLGGVITLIYVIYAGYQLNWTWTGFGSYTSLPHERTLWDWAQLLIVPIVVAFATYLFNRAASRNQQKSAQVKDQTDRAIAEDGQRETALQTYFDKMSELLLHENLRESKPDDKVQYIARVRTITVISRLNANRNGSLLRFLRESGLIKTIKMNGVINLSKADLRGSDLSGTDMSGVDLSEADLRKANLSGIDLSEAILTKANLSETNLRGVGTVLTKADLREAILIHADLRQAILREANLSRTDQSNALYGAILFRANLNGADLSMANLSWANLHQADLCEADLINANLRGAYLREANLSVTEQSAAAVSRGFRYGANMRETLYGANLREADLREANLSGANLREALQLHFFGETLP